MPSTKAIARALYYQSFDNHGVFAIRFPREYVPDTEESFGAELPFMRWRYEGNSKSKKLAIIAVGPKEREILEAVKSHFLDVEVIDPVYLYPLQEDNLYPLLAYKHVLVYDAYGIKEGFAEAVASALMELRYKGSLHIRAIARAFVLQDKTKGQMGQFGLLVDQIIEEIKRILDEENESAA